MFYQLNWQQMEKNWKVICTAPFYYIVTHYSVFCLLIPESSSPASNLKKKVAAAAHQPQRFVFSAFQLRGVSPWMMAKRAIRAKCLSFHQPFNAKI